MQESRTRSKAVLYIHGKGGNSTEAEHYAPLFPGCRIVGFDYKAGTPWEAKAEFTAYLEKAQKEFDEITVIANSIGAYFLMNAGNTACIRKAFFISPVVDMEKLITGMMQTAGVTEDDLKLRKTVETSFGETLSYEYLCYVREHPVKWDVPTTVLYGEKDALTSYETISAFAEKTGASLHVMPGGEHWFHTDEQMAFLDKRIHL